MSMPEVLVAGLQPCPVCRSTAYDMVWQEDKRQYGTCHACGVAFVRPFERGGALEVGEATSSVTNPVYLEMMKKQAVLRGKAAESMAARRLEVYTSTLGRVPQRICEIGAGDGAFSVGYSKLGVNYVGADVNPDMVEMARSLGRNIVDGGPAGVLKLGQKFDVVFCSQTLEHVLEPVPFLEQIWHLLAEGGLLHVDVPDHNSLSSWSRRILPRNGEYGFLQPPHHQIAYTVGTLGGLLKRAGFRLLWSESRSNFDPLWGQLTVGPSPVRRWALRVAGLIGMGSILVALTQKNSETM